MEPPFANGPFDVVAKVSEVERVVPVEGRMWVGGAWAVAVDFLFFFFFFFWLQSLLLWCMKKRDGIRAQRVERPEDCVDGKTMDGEGKSVVRKKMS